MEPPKGKRTIRETVSGSICGYIGRKFWINFGDRFNDHAIELANAWKEETI